MQKLSIDFGGSTIDVLRFEEGQMVEAESYERHDVRCRSLYDFLTDRSIDLQNVEQICVTGGKTHAGELEVTGIPVVRVNEIEAIGRGGSILSGEKDCLAVSMGTGTCMVAAHDGEFTHVGGTGVGGGTFMSLSKLLLKEVDPGELKNLFESGDRRKVDLSVQEIVGGPIGRVKGETTASNLGKILRASEEIDFGKADLAAGIANLIGQTIATAAVFAARAEGLHTIVLGGKLTRMQQIADIIFEVGELYEREILLPKNAEFISAIGALG